MKKITFLILSLIFTVAAFSQSTCNQTFSATGGDGDPTVLAVTAAEINCADPATPSALTLVNSAESLVSANCTGNGGTSWFEFTLAITGGVSDGASITGCAGAFDGIDLTGFTSLTITSADTDAFGDTVTIEIDVQSTFTSTTPPNCTALISPLNGDTDVNEESDITWAEPAGGVNGYFVAVGTSSGMDDVFGLSDVGNVTTLALPTLTFDQMYFVNIVPYNANGQPTGCTEESFTVRSLPPTGEICANPFLMTLEADCSSATPLTVDFANSTDLGFFSCDDFGANNGFWFDFTTGPTGAVTFNVSGTNNEYAIFDACGGNELICGGISEATTVSGFAPNTNYKMAIWRDTATTGTSDICFEEVSCLFPTGLTATVTGTTSADIAWTAGNTPAETAWEYVLQDAGTGLPTAAGVATTDNPLMLSGLTEGNEYELYLRADCSSSFSVWAGPVTWFQALPPANDLCSGATMVTVGSGSCGTDVTGTNVAATDSGVAQATCATATYAGGDIWYTFMMPMGETELTYNRSASDFSTTQVELYSGDCMTLVEVDCTTATSNTFTGLTGGATYYLRIYDWGNNDFGNVTFCLGTPAPPSTNTTCATADTITCGETLDGNSSASMGTSEDSGCAMGVNGLWYTFTGTGFDVTLTSTASFDHRMAIAAGSCGTLVNEVCRDFSTQAETYTFTTVDGESYYVYLAHFSDGNTSTGTVSLTLECAGPPNDECANAEAVTLGNEVSGDNTGATDSMVAGSTCFNGNVRDLWYAVDADAVGEIYVNGLTAGYQYAIYSDCAGTELSCNAEATGLTDGNTYYIRITDDGTGTTRASGAFTYTPSSASLSANDFDDVNSFKYYPNPVNNILTLDAQKNIESVVAYNMLGQEVLRLSPNTVNAEVDMSSLNTGAYFVKVSIQGATKTVRIIKQ